MPTTFTTSVYDAQNLSRSNTSRNAAPNSVSNDVQFARIVYTLTAGTDETSGDLIDLCVLPAGSIPLPELSRVTCDADPGTVVTLDIGTAANTDGWGDGLAIVAAGTYEFCTSALTQPAWLAEHQLVADTLTPGNVKVYATCGTVTAPTAGVNLVFTLAYKRGR